jgi:hypothetical protein
LETSEPPELAAPPLETSEPPKLAAPPLGAPGEPASAPAPPVLAGRNIVPPLASFTLLSMSGDVSRPHAVAPSMLRQ